MLQHYIIQGWGQSGTVDEIFDPLGDGSNYVLAYNNMNYQGTILTPGTDASLMEYLHVDIWALLAKTK